MRFTVICRGVMDSHWIFPVTVEAPLEVSALDKIREVNKIFGGGFLVPIYLISGEIAYIEENPVIQIGYPIFIEDLTSYLTEKLGMDASRPAYALAHAERRIELHANGFTQYHKAAVHKPRVVLTREDLEVDVRKVRDTWEKFIVNSRETMRKTAELAELDVERVEASLWAILKADREKCREKMTGITPKGGVRMRRQAAS